MMGGPANLNSGSVYNPFLDAEMLDAGVKQKITDHYQIQDVNSISWVLIWLIVQNLNLRELIKYSLL